MARHRLTKFLLRTGRRPPLGLKAWTERYIAWLEQIRYTQPAQEVTLVDCLNEVEHMSARVKRLEEAILEVVKLAPQPMQDVIRGLQALRGVAHISAVTIAAELGNISSRFESARNLMGYCGVFPSEDSSGKRIRRGGITKAGNAHLRRIVVESAWSYRHLPRVGAKLRKRQQGVPAEITEIAWKAQNRLHKRYMKLTMAGKDQRKTMTAIARELLGFIWAIANQGRSCVQATNGGMTRAERTKAKTFQIRKRQKTNQPMNNVIQIEDRVSRSRSKHEGESSADICDRLSRTRVCSQRQLPTDHDYAVPTREYQLDQSSPLPATAAADPVLETTNTKTTPTIRRC